MDAREEIDRRLRAAGLSDSEIAAAERDGRAPTLAVELALGEAPRHTLTHIARESGLDTRFVRELMQAVGRPNPAQGERVFSDEDLEFARTVRRFTKAGIPREGILEVSRVLSIGMANAAGAVRRLAGDTLLEPGDSEHMVGLRYANAADVLVPLVGKQLNYHFRAHLRDGVRRELASEAEREAGHLAGTRDIVVGFADLVNYTKLGARLPPEDVGRIAGRLTELAVRSVRRPVQLVKTIGDAAMFVSPDRDPAPLLRTLAELATCIHAEGEEFPDVRIGVACGPATTRGGDWFGAPVNVASRVTGQAKPGSLFATEEVQAQTPDLPWKKKRKRGLRGVDGRVRLYALDAERLSDLAG